MGWISTHPYATALTLTALLLLGGALIVTQHSAVPPQDPLSAWNGTETFGSTPPPARDTASVPAMPRAPYISPTDNGGETYKQVSPFVTPKTPGLKNTDATPATRSNDGFTDFETFAASLSHRTAADNKAHADSQHIAVSDVYAFVPTGMFDVSTADAPKRTPVQTALYQYGNDMGNQIKSFENTHQNQVSVFKDYAEDRSNPDKQAAMKKLGADYSSMGQSLSSIEPPPQVRTAHTGLLASYADVGTKLAAIPNGIRDEDFVAAMETYNAAAETFVRHLVDVALIFPTYQVQFANDEGGSVFMMPSSGGL